MTRRAGELVQWNNKGGYGFARDDAGHDFYVHISKVYGGVRPRIGDRLTFEIAVGRKGRPSAVDVRVTQAERPPASTLQERRPTCTCESACALPVDSTTATSAAAINFFMMLPSK